MSLNLLSLNLGGGGGSGGGISGIGSLDGNGAVAEGLSIVGTDIYAQSASTTNPGLVNNAAQSFSGKKTFTFTSIDASSESALAGNFQINNTADIADAVVIGCNMYLAKNDNHDMSGQSLVLGGLMGGQNSGSGTVGRVAGAFCAGFNAGTGTVDTCIGSVCLVENDDAGTINQAAGVAAQIDNVSSGTMTGAVGLLVEITNEAAGSIIDSYVVRCDQLDGTNKHGIWINIADPTMTNKISGKILLPHIPAYADDAAAGAAGLVTGDMYQTTGAGAAPLNAAGIVMLKQ